MFVYVYIYIYIYIIYTYIPALSPPAVPFEAAPPEQFTLRLVEVFGAFGALLGNCSSSQSINVKPSGTCRRKQEKGKGSMGLAIVVLILA
jgi:hypothetical protein